jgi:pilus assembly protein CpaB
MDQAEPGWRRWLRTDVLLTLVGLGAGVGGALLGGKYLAARAAAIEAEAARRYQVREVVVASADVTRGGTLDGSNLAVRKIPQEFVPPGAVTPERAGDLVGSRAAIDLGRGSPIVMAALAADGPVARLSSALGANERALTVAVDELGSHAGSVAPGDHIDLYYGRRESAESLLVPLLQQVEVLAAGDSFSRPGAAEGEGRHYSTLTLRVSAADAPRVLLAQQTGELMLLLRAPEDEQLQPTSIRSSSELLRRPAIQSGAGRIEVLIGGTGEMMPERRWLAVGAGLNRDAT